MARLRYWLVRNQERRDDRWTEGSFNVIDLALVVFWFALLALALGLCHYELRRRKRDQLA